MPTAQWHRPIRDGALRALEKIFNEGFYADKVIQFALKENRKWGSRDRRQFAEAVYEIVRWYRKLWVLSGLTWPKANELPSPGAAELNKILDVWLEVGAGIASQSTGKGFACDQSIPDWLHELGSRELGQERWIEIMSELNKPAPVFLRTNVSKIKVKDLVNKLNAEGFSAEEEKTVPGAIRLKERANVFRSKLFTDGNFEVQDLHSQIVGQWMKVEPGQRVIDACAGAGGKTLNLAGLMENRGKILAMDVSEKKLEELQRRTRRAGTPIVETRKIESSKTIKRLADGADRLLLDVPCTGLGVLRRNPDAKWKLKFTDLESLRSTQQEILQSYSQMVKPGGLMVYSTCSILPSENSNQIETFMSQFGSQWELEQQETLWPAANRGDGFFIARLRRLKLGTPAI